MSWYKPIIASAHSYVGYWQVKLRDQRLNEYGGLGDETDLRERREMGVNADLHALELANSNFISCTIAAVRHKNMETNKQASLLE